MANTKRKDKSRKVLRKGESQRPDGTYQFRWTDENRKRHCIYARNLDDLRYNVSKSLCCFFGYVRCNISVCAKIYVSTNGVWKIGFSQTM